MSQRTDLPHDAAAPTPRMNAFAQGDRLRRRLGEQLDTLGWGPRECPSRRVFSETCVTLKEYDPMAEGGPVVLLVPAPIKRAYLWDIAPWASVVRRCLDGGLRVYLLQWEPPGEAERGFGLSDYADRLILDCLEAIRAESGRSSAFLAGHSLGGTCTALFASLHPERVDGLVLLGSPLHFGSDVGLFGPLMAAAPPVRNLTERVGNVPGSLLNSLSLLASPVSFGAGRWLDGLASLSDPQALWTHLLVERWTLDEMPLAEHFFEEVVEQLYREDRFMRGTLRIGGVSATPAQVTAPLLSVVDRHCDVAPPAAMLPFHHAARSRIKKLLWYSGDVGVSLRHVGMLVGSTAHRRLWPAIIDWMHAEGGSRRADEGASDGASDDRQP